MTFEYCYYDKPERPDFDAVMNAVALSAMENKDYAYFEWQQAEAEICCRWNSQLLTADKLILDQIINDNF